MWIVGLGALVVGFSLGFFGGGGSILTVPLLVYGADIPVQDAIPLSLVLVGLTSGMATVGYGKGRLVDWKHGGVFAGFGILGAAGGARINHWLPAAALLLLFGFLMVVMAVLMLRPPTLSPCERIGLGRGFCSSVAGIGVGFTTGLLGAGGGFLIVPALVLLLGVEMNRAVATSVMIITLNSASALAFAQPKLSQYLTWPWLAVLGAALSSAWWGAKWAPRLPQLRLRYGFAGLVFLVGLGILAAQL
ncbi:MAG: sulfite exporter TauE/SafE family protein [bacterium]